MTEQLTSGAGPSRTIPAGQSLLGRVINYAGEPLDNLGPLEATVPIAINPGQTVPDYRPDEAKLLETGLKAVDLFAPLSIGSTMGLFSLPGLGKQVVVGEILYNLARRHRAIMIFAGLEERLTGPHDTLNPWKELGVSQYTLAVMGKAQNDAGIAHQLILTALTLAEFFRDEAGGRVVILYVDEQLAEKGQLAAYRQRLRHQGNGSIVTLFGEPSNPQPSTTMAGLTLDSWLTFDPVLAGQTIFPAIDSQQSGSHLFQTRGLTASHLETAQQVREYLALYKNSNGHLASSEVARGRKLQLFLSQPFFVAESFTGQPGSYIPLDATLAGCQAILAGEVDNLADEAFAFGGTIEEIKEKAAGPK